MRQGDVRTDKIDSSLNSITEKHHKFNMKFDKNGFAHFDIDKHA